MANPDWKKVDITEEDVKEFREIFDEVHNSSLLNGMIFLSAF